MMDGATVQGSETVEDSDVSALCDQLSGCNLSGTDQSATHKDTSGDTAQTSVNQASKSDAESSVDSEASGPAQYSPPVTDQLSDCNVSGTGQCATYKDTSVDTAQTGLNQASKRGPESSADSEASSAAQTSSPVTDLARTETLPYVNNSLHALKTEFNGSGDSDSNVRKNIPAVESDCVTTDLECALDATCQDQTNSEAGKASDVPGQVYQDNQLAQSVSLVGSDSTVDSGVRDYAQKNTSSDNTVSTERGIAAVPDNKSTSHEGSPSTVAASNTSDRVHTVDSEREKTNSKDINICHPASSVPAETSTATSAACAVVSHDGCECESPTTKSDLITNESVQTPDLNLKSELFCHTSSGTGSTPLEAADINFSESQTQQVVSTETSQSDNKSDSDFTMSSQRFLCQSLHCHDTHILQYFGFKEYCEERYPCQLAFDHKNSRIMVGFDQIHGNLTRCVRTEIDSFRKGILRIDLERLTNKLLLEHFTAREIVSNAVCQEGMRCYIKETNNIVTVYCFAKDINRCKAIVNRSVMCETFPLKCEADKEVAFNILTGYRAVCECVEEHGQDRTCIKFHVAATSDVSESLFERLQRRFHGNSKSQDRHQCDQGVNEHLSENSSRTGAERPTEEHQVVKTNTPESAMSSPKSVLDQPQGHKTKKREQPTVHNTCRSSPQKGLGTSGLPQQMQGTPETITAGMKCKESPLSMQPPGTASQPPSGSACPLTRGSANPLTHGDTSQPPSGSASQLTHGDANQQTHGNAKQTHGNAKQTHGDASQQTHGNAKQTHGDASQQTHGNANQTHGNAKQTHGNAKQTHGNANQTHGNAKQTHGNAKQTHGNANQQTHGNANQTHGDANQQTHGDANQQTHGNAKQTHGNAKQTHGNANQQTHGDANQTHGNANQQTHGNANQQTHGDTNQQTHGDANQQTHGNANQQIHGNANQQTHGNAKQTHGDANQLTDGSANQPQDYEGAGQQQSNHRAPTGGVHKSDPVHGLAENVHQQHQTQLDNYVHVHSKRGMGDRGPSQGNVADFQFVEIPDFISHFFRTDERLRERFTFRLAEKGMYINVHTLQKGLIAVVNRFQGSQDIVHSVLHDIFYVQYVTVKVMIDLETDIAALSEAFPEHFHAEFLKAERQWAVVYRIDMPEDMKPVLEAVLFRMKYKVVYVQLPGYFMSHLRTVWKELKDRVEICNLQLKIKDGQGCIEVSAERQAAEGLEQEINCVLGGLIFRETQVGLSTGHFLQSKDRQVFVKDLETRHQCTINIQTPEQHVLLHALSPYGQQLMVYEGKLAATDAEVMVLPLCDGQKTWPLPYKDILDTAFLSSSTREYAKTVGSEKKQKTLALHGHGSLSSKKIVVMAVPPDQDKAFREKVKQSLIELLQICGDSTVALPLVLGHLDGRTALRVICEILADETSQNRSIILKLYLDPGSSTLNSSQPGLGWVDEELTSLNWATSGYLKTDNPRIHRTHVLVGEILKMKADVLVNSTDPELKHGQGIVSQLLLKGAGRQLTEQCRQLYPQGLGNHMVAVTDSFKMNNFRKIFHVALLQTFWPTEDELSDIRNELLAELRICVQSCLMLASVQQFSSIMFPSLGTGMLRYPPDRVAHTMFSAIEDFFREMPHSSLQQVFISCYHKNIALIQVFQAEETVHRYGVYRDGLTVAKAKAKAKGAYITTQSSFSSPKPSTIQIVEGDARANPCFPTDVVICSNSRSLDIWTHFQQHLNFVPIPEPSRTKEDIKKAMEKAKDSSSILICLQTIDTEQFSDVVEAVSRGLGKRPLHVVLVVSDPQEFDTVIKQATGKWRQLTFYSKDPNEGGEAFPRDKATVQICGQKAHVEDALTMIHEIKVPDTAEADSSVNPDRDDEAMEVDEESGVPFSNAGCSQDSQLLGLYVPENYVGGDCIAALKELPQVLKSSRLPGAELWIKKDDLLSVAEQVSGIIRQPENKSGPSAGSNSSSQPPAQHPEESGFTQELNSVDYEALQALMTEEFDHVRVVERTKDSVKISCHGPTAADTKARIDSLRQEVVQLADKEDLEKITKPVDTTSEGVPAYMVPIHDQAKVVIFSLDYTALSKAKHLLKVKLGKVKVTSRGRRRFEGQNDGTGDGAFSQSAPSSLDHIPSPSQRTDFTTKCGIKVSVYKTDITKLPVDAIVNAANEHLNHGGGVAYAISKAAGFALEDEGQDHIRKNGPLRVREVLATTGGSLPCKAVLHAVGPQWSHYKDKALCGEHLADTVFNCLDKANSLGFTSLAIPSISSAIFGVPQDVCAKSYLSAIQSYDKHCGGSTRLKEVHFVDVNDRMISTIQDTFTRYWHTDLSTPLATNRPGSSAAAAVHTSPHGSDQPETNAAGDSGSSRPQASPSITHGPVPDVPPLPCFKIETVSGKTDQQLYKFQFEGLDLDLLFCCGTLDDVGADALVLWQEIGNTGRDRNSKKMMNKLSQRDLTKVTVLTASLTSEGLICVTDTKKGVLIFPVVSPYSTLSQEQVQRMLGEMLQKMDQSGKRSVAIPAYLQTQKDAGVSNKAVADFAAGVYSAVKDYAKQSHRSLREIHIISEDQHIVQSLCDTVQEKLVCDMSTLEEQPGVQPQAEDRQQAEAGSDFCTICLEDKITNPKSLTCGHTFCTSCIDDWLSKKSTCPNCHKIQGVLFGTQPTGGTMRMVHYSSCLNGHWDTGSYTISYYIPGGKQTDKHPNPGKYYTFESRTAYLPDTTEGRTVLMLLKTAFDRRLIFTVGRSSTTGREDVVIWNDIHHKTAYTGGETGHGYPDPEYLKRVTTELLANGVTEKDLTDKQKDFIINPKRYISYSGLDFSSTFNTTGVQ